MDCTKAIFLLLISALAGALQAGEIRDVQVNAPNAINTAASGVAPAFHGIGVLR